MVGDRLDTDILFGQNGGLTTMLCLSGAAAARPACPASPAAAASNWGAASAGRCGPACPAKCSAGTRARDALALASCVLLQASWRRTRRLHALPAAPPAQTTPKPTCFHHPRRRDHRGPAAVAGKHNSSGHLRRLAGGAVGGQAGRGGVSARPEQPACAACSVPAATGLPRQAPRPCSSVLLARLPAACCTPSTANPLLPRLLLRWPARIFDPPILGVLPPALGINK